MTATTPHGRPEPKIDPVRRPAAGLRPAGLRPDGSPDDNDRVEIGPTDLAFAEWAALGLEAPNLERMRARRLGRVCAELQARDYAGALLFDPLNIRYATDATNMQLWIVHNPARAAFVSADGYVVLWEFHNGAHLSAHLPLVRELRTGAGHFYMLAGDAEERLAGKFADQVIDVLSQHGGDNRRLAIDRMEIAGIVALQHITANEAILKPGVGFTELTELGHRLPEEFRAQRYGVKYHGVGLCDEFPCIYYPEDFIAGAFDYVLEPGMVLCVEAYIGAVGGRPGVKLENQVLITETGPENLTRCPFDDRLMG